MAVARIATMSINNNPQTISVASQDVKGSPDCVATPNFQDHPKALLLDKLLPVQRYDLNVPPLLTPLQQHKLVCETERSSLPQMRIPPGVPPLPPRSPFSKQTQRSASESQKGMNRRAIFGQYWDTKVRAYSTGNIMDQSARRKTSTTEVSTPPPRGRKRSSNLSILESAALPPEHIDYRMFAPSKEHADWSPICSRFASVEAVPVLEALPPLPSPLRRLCHEGSSTRSMPGMYPLLTPVPILRQSSYRSIGGGKKTSSSSSEPSKQSIVLRSSFNLTQSYRPRGKEWPVAAQSSTSFSSNSESSSTKSGVLFDPRVTVTEFEDSVERSWYSEIELERLKQETILLAQEYLLTHSEEAEKYNRAKLDPITGTFRKKALFSLPVLSYILDGDGIPKPNGTEYEELLESQVKNILIVDPNTAILNLFCKSMNSMFPKARLHTTPGGEEALQLVSAELQREYGSSPNQHRNFDIIIVEQRLCRSLQAQEKLEKLQHQPPSGHALPHNNSCLGISEMAKHDKRSFSVLNKPNSFMGNERRQIPQSCINMCGSDLLKAILNMEEQTFAALPNSRLRAPSSADASPISTGPFQWRALLIGVSIQPDRDAKTLKEAGTDVIWGKPIPRVGDALRNQLLNALVMKRRRSVAEKG